jgi:X-X-X-Leu-X-X-Gly heptad repeat protein
MKQCTEEWHGSMAQLQKQLAELVDGISKLHDAFLVMRTKNPYGSSVTRAGGVRNTLNFTMAGLNQ